MGGGCWALSTRARINKTVNARKEADWYKHRYGLIHVLNYMYTHTTPRQGGQIETGYVLFRHRSSMVRARARERHRMIMYLV